MFVLSSSTCMVKGSFHKPETVLDAVARSQHTPEGVIEITSRDVSGRIGVSNNNLIIGGVIERTGETGIGAVCKLLLLPFATYNFRHAVPVDQWHLNQELNLHFNEVKRFLIGPSSIGLARPADQSLNNLKALTLDEGKALLADRNSSVEDVQFTWELTNFGKACAPTWETTNFRKTFKITEEELATTHYAVDPQLTTSGAYLTDCNELLEIVEKKRQETADVISFQERARRSQTDLEILKPGPLPSRSKKEKSSTPLLVAVAVGAVMGVMGIYAVCKSAQSSTVPVANQPAGVQSQTAKTDLGSGAASASTVASAPANNAAPAAGCAPFSLPGANPINSAPPANVAPASTASEPTAVADNQEASSTESSDEGPIPLPASLSSNSSSTRTPAVSSSNSSSLTTGKTWVTAAEDRETIARNQNLPQWMDAVRRDPSDADARKQLSHALLASGNPIGSIQQFHALMKLRPVDPTEIVEYADDITLFAGKDVARKFLINILRSDPSQEIIRQKLRTMQ